MTTRTQLNSPHTDVSILSSMPYLVTLNLSGNRLAQTPNLDPPPSNLQHLDLARNQIMTIGSLASYRYLKSLSLDRNLIKRIEGVQECRSLTWLSLCGNGVTRIENLEGLPLKQLDLVGQERYLIYILLTTSASFLSPHSNSVAIVYVRLRISRRSPNSRTCDWRTTILRR